MYFEFISEVKLELPFLLEKLKGCKASWFHLGVFLGINEAELKKFESERKSNDVIKCFSDTLIFWLNSGESDLTTLVKAVELSGHRKLAENVRLKYQGTRCNNSKEFVCINTRSCFDILIWLH